MVFLLKPRRHIGSKCILTLEVKPTIKNNSPQFWMIRISLKNSRLSDSENQPVYLSMVLGRNQGQPAGFASRFCFQRSVLRGAFVQHHGGCLRDVEAALGWPKLGKASAVPRHSVGLVYLHTSMVKFLW